MYDDGDISVLLGNGDGTFQNYVTYGAGDNPKSAAIGDLDGDNIPDLLTANIASDTVSVLLGNGDGTFQTAVDYGAGEWPVSVAIGDLNIDIDGYPDLVAANRWSDNVSVLLGNGDGTFQEDVTYGAGDEPWSIAIGDLDSDGHLDLATANTESDNVSVLINTTKTLTADLTCVPFSGTLPFVINMTVSLSNPSTEYGRRFAGQIDLITAGGWAIPDWKSGWINVGPDDSATRVLHPMLPAIPIMFGVNTATLVVEDVTPSPYNQPPYPPSGDTDTDACEVVGIAP